MFDDFKLPKIREFEDLIQTPYEKPGIYDQDKAIYSLALPKTQRPNLINPYVLTDGDVTLEPGHYEVGLSDDKRYLLLIQSRELKALVPAIRVVISDSKKKEIEKREEKYQEELKKLKKKKKTTKKLEFQMETYKQLDMSASISDSKKGYYIIEYINNNVTAWGYIPY